MTETKEVIKQLPGLPAHLIGKGITSTAQAQELGRKGGQYSGPNKSLGAHLRWLKQKGLTDEKSQELYKILTDPAVSALDARLLVEAAKSIANKEKTMKNVETAARLTNEWHKMHHKDSGKGGDTHVEVNVDSGKHYEFVIKYEGIKDDNSKVVDAIVKDNARVDSIEERLPCKQEVVSASLTPGLNNVGLVEDGKRE